MAAVTSSLSFSTLTQSSQRKLTTFSSTRLLGSDSDAVRFRLSLSLRYVGVRTSNSVSKIVVRCSSSESDPPTVSETKLNFLKAYKRPIPSIYNSVLQELIVQQHLMRYKKSYRYDPVFALGFVTVYDQLMEGYPSDEDRDAIFQAYINALKEDPAQYRVDAQKLEEWARAKNSTSLIEFSSREGEVEGILKDIAERAGGKGDFSYSRFFAVGLFRLLELANAMEPTILEKLCSALNINKRSVDRDLDVYRNLLSKLVQAKELLKEYIDREKKKIEERAEPQKANEAISKCLGQEEFSNMIARYMERGLDQEIGLARIRSRIGLEKRLIKDLGTIDQEIRFANERFGNRSLQPNKLAWRELTLVDEKISLARLKSRSLPQGKL